MREKAGRALAVSWKVAWYGLLISLPVTSFPLLSRLLGGSQVAPLALIPLAWLVLTWLPYSLLKRNASLPAESRPLLYFVLAALLSTLLAFFLDTPPYKNHTIAANTLEGVQTLGVGLGFYLVMTTRLQSGEADKTLKYISIGGMILLAWSLAQGVVVWLFGNQYPAWMVTVHSLFSTTSLLRLFPQMRVTGLAYEPSWLAHMLTLLYLPLWMAACWNRQSVFRLRLGKVMAEDLLLGGGVIVLLLALPRISLLAFLLALGWILLLAGKRITQKFRSREGNDRNTSRRWLGKLLPFIMLVVFIFGLLGVVTGLSIIDDRLAPIFQLGGQIVSGELFREGVMPIAIRLGFAERVVFWEMGWRIFEQHPVVGVGLGNSGQFALEGASHWAWELMESRRILFRESFLPNTKSLWTRLLSETGVVGTVLFMVWLIVLWVSSRNLRNHPDQMNRTIGLAGQLMLISLIVEGFSVDSFALPYWWLIPGMLTAASFFARREETSAPAEEKA